MPFGTNRNITHGRIGTNSSQPANGKYVVFIGMASTRYHRRGKRINKGARFPVLFHSFDAELVETLSMRLYLNTISSFLIFNSQ